MDQLKSRQHPWVRGENGIAGKLPIDPNKIAFSIGPSYFYLL